MLRGGLDSREAWLCSRHVGCLAERLAACALPPAHRLQAEQHAATATELGGGAVVERCEQLQADLMNCQQVGNGGRGAGTCLRMVSSWLSARVHT